MLLNHMTVPERGFSGFLPEFAKEDAMQATIKIIAERAGVSIGTVDRVLHNRPYVKAEVRARVLAVMEELDYRPNRVASALAMSGTPWRFAVVHPAWEGYVGEAMAAGTARFLEERRDYNVQVVSYPYRQADMTQCLRLLDRAVEEKARAVALCAAGCPALRDKLEELAERHIPVAAFNSDIPGSRRICYVGEDAHRAGRIAGEIAAKFLGPGDPLLLVYAGPEYAGHRGRAEGFLERLEERGFRREDCRIAATHENFSETLAAVSAALADTAPPRYIYMANQSVAACAQAIRKAGLAGKIRVLVHDSGPEVRQLLREGLVDFTIDQNLAYQSYQALSVLFAAVVEHKEPERDCFYPESPILNAETI